MDFILKLFGSIIQFFYTLTGNNYVIGLVAFTLIAQILLLPIAIKQQKNQVKQASLAPKIMAIRNKYKGRTDQATQQKMQQETMELYQRENFNPAGGCLPLLIQLPIIMLLYNVVQQPLTYILQYGSDAITRLGNWFQASGNELTISGELIKAAESNSSTWKFFSETFDVGLLPDFKLFGLDLTQVPLAKDASGDLLNPWLLIIPAVTFVAMYGSQIIIRRFSYQSPEVKAQQKSTSMRIMNIAMPLMSVYFAAIMPGAMGVYWILRNIFATVQQIVLSKAIPVPQFTEEDYKAAERELAGKNPKKKNKSANLDPNRPKVRSLHYIDEDDDETVAELPAKTKAVEESREKEEVPVIPEEKTKEGVVTAPLKDDSDKPRK
ncbi:MAG: YidC/Oxa1 family membrane protein insertase [Ruminococcaceae bacterium]|nr:YidC/Oxa1 family membrane protein insertase [Oscillospiraceae bacterium]